MEIHRLQMPEPAANGNAASIAPGVVLLIVIVVVVLLLIMDKLACTHGGDVEPLSLFSCSSFTGTVSCEIEQEEQVTNSS
jgi:hypothetical protein